MRFGALLLCCVALASAACHPGPVINAGAKQPPVGGTIAGVVTTTDPLIAVPGRKVTATETTTGSRYDTTTAANGGYTIKVPEGRYRLDVELRAVSRRVPRAAVDRERVVCRARDVVLHDSRFRRERDHRHRGRRRLRRHVLQERQDHPVREILRQLHLLVDVLFLPIVVGVPH